MKKLLLSSVFVLVCSCIGFAQPSITGSVKPAGAASYLASVKLHFNNVEELQKYKWDELASVLERSEDAIRKDFKLVVLADVDEEKYPNKEAVPESFTVKITKEKDTSKMIQEAQRSVQEMVSMLAKEN